MRWDKNFSLRSSMIEINVLLSNHASFFTSSSGLSEKTSSALREETREEDKIYMAQVKGSAFFRTKFSLFQFSRYKEMGKRQRNMEGGEIKMRVCAVIMHQSIETPSPSDPGQIGGLYKQQPSFGAKICYLSMDIICSERRTVFRERSSKKTMSLEEQIMSKDKYPSIRSQPN